MCLEVIERALTIINNMLSDIDKCERKQLRPICFGNKWLSGTFKEEKDFCKKLKGHLTKHRTYKKSSKDQIIQSLSRKVLYLIRDEHTLLSCKLKFAKEISGVTLPSEEDLIQKCARRIIFESKRLTTEMQSELEVAKRRHKEERYALLIKRHQWRFI